MKSQYLEVAMPKKENRIHQLRVWGMCELGWCLILRFRKEIVPCGIEALFSIMLIFPCSHESKKVLLLIESSPNPSVCKYIGAKESEF